MLEFREVAVGSLAREWGAFLLIFHLNVLVLTGVTVAWLLAGFSITPAALGCQNY